MMFGSFGFDTHMLGFCERVAASQVVPDFGVPIRKACVSETLSESPMTRRNHTNVKS